MEKFNPEQINSQKNYEKRVEGIINPSLKEKVIDFLRTVEISSFKNKDITKEDIIKIDAELELEARKASEGKGAESEEQKYFEKMKNSDLAFKKEEYGYGWEDNIIKGEINGQDVDIHYNYQDINDKKFKETYNGFLNKKQLLPVDAKRIFDEYSEIAEKRMGAIIKFIGEKEETEQKEKYEIEPGDSLEKIFPKG